MSYCRWSSDNWKSDIYCYESCYGGFVIHVAGNKRVGLETLPPDPMEMLADPNLDLNDPANADMWMAAYKAHMQALENLNMVPIGLPHDGETFCMSRPGEAAEKLRELQTLGYHVPQYAIDELEEEERNGWQPPVQDRAD